MKRLIRPFNCPPCPLFLKLVQLGFIANKIPITHIFHGGITKKAYILILKCPVYIGTKDVEKLAVLVSQDMSLYIIENLGIASPMIH